MVIVLSREICAIKNSSQFARIEGYKALVLQTQLVEDLFSN